MLIAFAANAQTDFAAPGYSCAADDAVLTGGSSEKFFLDETATPHHITWSDVALSANALATWQITASRGCYVSVSLDLGPVVASNKHNFEVKILDDKGNVKGTLSEGGENTASDQVKLLEDSILIPAAGAYTLELRNQRDWGKGTIKNVILTYVADAPSTMVEVESIALNKKALAIEVEEVELLVATVLPENAFDPSVTWVSSNDSIATVSETGLVSGIAAGTANIIAKAGEKADTCVVTVAAATIPTADFAEPLVLSGKKAHLEGAIWKNDAYKLYGDGGHNKNYGNASWIVNVTKRCIVSGKLNGVEGGHAFVLDVYADTVLVGTMTQPEDKTWAAGEIAFDTTVVFAKKGNYTFVLRNTQEWSSGKVESVTLTLEEELPLTCAEIYAKAKNDAVKLNDVVVTYVNAKNIYVTDGTAGMLVYLPANGSWEIGDVLSGIAGKVDIYNGIYEVKLTADQVAAVTVTDGEVPAPEVLTKVTAADMSKYILLKNIPVEGEFAAGTQSNINIVVGGDTIALRNQFKDGFKFEAGETYDIEALVTLYQSKLQLYFLKANMVPHTYTVAGNSDVLFGKAWDPKNEANDMVELLDGRFAWWQTDLKLAKSEIEFKVCKDHAYTHSWPAQNYKLAIPEDGIYTIEIYFDPAADDSVKVSAKAEKTGEAVIIPTLLMHGNFTGSWKDTDPFTLSEDSLYQVLKLELAAGDFEFGMKFDGAWKANGDTITRDIPSTSLTYTGDNMHIIADVAGEYTFVYVIATQTLNVIYPKEPKPVWENPIYKTDFFNKDWSKDTLSTAKWDAENQKVIVNIIPGKSDTWQGQLWLKLPMDVRAGYEYDLSFKAKANKTFGGTVVKYQENAEMTIIYDFEMKAGEEAIYSKENLRGVNGGNGILCLSFGYAPDSTDIELYDFAIVEHEATSPVAKFYVTGNDAFTADAGLEAAQAWHPDALPSYGDTLTVALKAGAAYQLKICVDGTWNTAKNFNDLTEKAAGLIDADGDNHNIGFSLVADGDVKIIYTAEVFKLEGNFVTEAIDNTFVGTKAVKMVKNGQLLIIRDGKTFTVLGQPIQ